MIRLAHIMKWIALGSTLVFVLDATSGGAKESYAPDFPSQERAVLCAVTTAGTNILSLGGQTTMPNPPIDDQVREIFNDSAPESLILKSAQAAKIGGNYSVTGTNPNGATYQGTVVIESNGGNRFSFFWRVGNQTFSGNGTLNGNTITVNWGQPSPVIYQVGVDGVLRGTWNNGRATETLTPR